MRIGINTLFMIPGEVGGSETYLRKTLAALAAGDSDDELVLFANHENCPVLREDFGAHPRIAVIELDLTARNRYARILKEQVSLPRLVKDAGVDLLWSPGYTAPVVCACPRVTTILDMQYKSHPEDFTLQARLTTAALVPLAAKTSRVILTISEFSKREVVSHLGVDASRIFVTPLGVDPTLGDAVPEAEERRMRKALGLGTRPFVLVVSNSYPHKNVATAVEAFGALMGETDHDLVVVGQPRRGERAVQDAMARLSEQTRVHRIHRVEYAMLKALYGAADLLIFPSVYEGFGLPVIEAMAAGTPVVAAPCEAVREHGGDAVEYAGSPSAKHLAAKIRDVLRWDECRRSERIAGACERARGFRWDITARKTLEAFRAALDTESVA